VSNYVSAEEYKITFEDDCMGTGSLEPAWGYGTGMVFLTINEGSPKRAQTVVHIDKLAEAVEKIKNGGGLG
jgi:hypothetical protein